MQRLTARLRRRLEGERGATAVVFALLLVPMLGFAAIAVDIGALYAEKARLQVAADAAAIAVVIIAAVTLLGTDLTARFESITAKI